MRRDMLRILDAGYRFEVGRQQWLQGVTQAIADCFDDGLGVGAYFFDASDPKRFVLGEVAFSGTGPQTAIEDTIRMNAGFPAQAIDELYAAADVAVEVSRAAGENFSLFASQLEAAGIGDVHAIFAMDPSRKGAMFGIPVRERRLIPARRRRTLGRIAAHLAAAQRLLLHGAPSCERADAIFDDRGRLQHSCAELSARESSALDAAVESERRARETLSRTDPDRALEIWQGLVQGRWSIVRHVERDGKRFILARRNEPTVRDFSNLTLREQQVVGYAALGHSLKLVGYELGISPSSVSTHLKSALRKLGIRTRIELTQVFGLTRSEAP